MQTNISRDSTFKVHTSIEELDPAQWNALDGAHIPFLRHEFFAALERTECVGVKTTWTPQFITLSDARGLAAAAPGFLKLDSYGEFVFDFAWAQAYSRYGYEYYPKLTVAVPFTPATGPRLLVRPDLDADAMRSTLLASIQTYVTQNALSSAHLLFTDEASRLACERAGWLLRRDCQFHWTNRGYASFDAYLETFTAEKRKKAKRERRRVEQAGIRFITRFGHEIDKLMLDRVYELHRDTFLRHGHEPYLNRACFGELSQTLGDSMMIKIALHDDVAIATAVFFRSGDTLYGRYWGAVADYHSLHFETCYHQGVEFCIEHGLTRFEPGTQGEHKVSRGFEPTLTWSAHFIADPQFRTAIGQYLAQEAHSVEAYAAEVRDHVPYKGRPSQP